LSFDARGVLAFILTFPSNWQFGLAWLCRDQGIGRDRARRIIRELVDAGYCQRGRARNADGTLGAYEYVFSDEPESLISPLPENPDTAPAPENPSVVSEQIVVASDWKPVTGEPALANPPPTKDCQSYKDKNEDRQEHGLHVEPSGTDGAPGDRLPFTRDVLAEIRAIDIDLAPLVERYQQRTAGRRIKDPSAYLLKMARDEASKRLGVPAAALEGLGSRNREQRANVQAASVGAAVQPSAAVLKGVERRARARGDDPGEMIAAWRAWVGGARVGDADQSLLAFELSTRAAKSVISHENVPANG
jgi:hypothetical protein